MIQITANLKDTYLAMRLSAFIEMMCGVPSDSHIPHSQYPVILDGFLDEFHSFLSWDVTHGGMVDADELNSMILYTRRFLGGIENLLRDVDRGD